MLRCYNFNSMFKLWYFLIGEDGCGGVLNGASGNISSPGHPNSYSDGANCTW